MTRTLSIAQLTAEGGRGAYNLDRLNPYPYWPISLLGKLTVVCMGFLGIFHIAVDYRNPYCDPIKTALFGHITTHQNTLCLCGFRVKVLYEQCVDTKVKHAMLMGES